jgi:hypothetical protein
LVPIAQYLCASYLSIHVHRKGTERCVGVDLTGLVPRADDRLCIETVVLRDIRFVQDVPAECDVMSYHDELLLVGATR